MRYVREEEAAALVPPEDAVAAVEAALARSARGAALAGEEAGVSLDGGRLWVEPAADVELGVASAAAVAAFPREGGRSAALVFARDRPELLAAVETERLRRLAAGAALAVAARLLARPCARSVGLIGCGALGATVLECLRAAIPALDRAVAHCRDERRREAFAAAYAAEPADYGTAAAQQDVVVTATSSLDPVLRGDWLAEGALVCAAGATWPGARELDNGVLERSSFVCVDSVAAARRLADLAEPVERGVLDWLEVHALGEVVLGEVEGRQARSDVVLVKCAGTPELTLALAHLALERA